MFVKVQCSTCLTIRLSQEVHFVLVITLDLLARGLEFLLCWIGLKMDQLWQIIDTETATSHFLGMQIWLQIPVLVLQISDAMSLSGSAINIASTLTGSFNNLNGFLIECGSDTVQSNSIMVTDFGKQ